MTIRTPIDFPRGAAVTREITKALPEKSPYRWINVSMDAPFTPRDGAGALVYRDRMWLIGGWNNDDREYFPRDCVNDVWSTSDGVRWTLEKPNTYGTRAFDPHLDWEGRHTAGYAVHEDAMWIIGGDPLQRHYQNDVWKSIDGKKWSLVNAGRPVPWGPRVLHHTVHFQDRIWVMGGQTMPQYGPAPERFFADVWHTDNGIGWEQIIPRTPSWPARGMIGGCAVFQDRMWILGGGTYDTPQTSKRTFLNDVWSSPDGVNWECHTARAPWNPRQYHEVAVFDGKLWVMEGFQQTGNSNDVWYSSDGVNWHELEETPWDARHAASVYVFEDALWMVAGNNMRSDVWKLVRQ